MTEIKVPETILEFRSKNPKQIQAAKYWIDEETEVILYGGAKGGGKSYLGASLIFGDALIYPETHYFIARQALIDLRKFTIPTIHEVFKNWGIDIDMYAHYNDQDHVFLCYNKSKVFLIDCKDEPRDPLFERFGSMQMTRGMIEEAGEVVENAKANLWLSIGRWKNQEYKLKKKLLITANPKKGWMKREFVDPAKQNLLAPSKKYIQAFPQDNVYLPPDYIKSLSEEKDRVRRQRLFEGNWDYDEDDDSLISSDSLSDSFTNTITKDGERYLVVDVARKGKDSTVINFFDGLESYRIEKYEKKATTETSQLVRDFAASERVPYSNIIVDEDGVGGGVVDMLKGVRGFIANSTPLPTGHEIRERKSKVDSFLIPKRNFSNLRSQCVWKLAELINEHRISFQTPEYRDIIIEELSAQLRQKEIDSDGKLQAKPKSEVKEIIGRSPDVGDTYIMRAWFELKKDSKDEDPVVEQTVHRVQRDVMDVNRSRQTLNSTK